ncbi:hypothetical protein LZL87_008825 [Fusarium oxysporum]|nr:hypothetical protein LZL87_008825 [Fusarium oxysporum]
MADLSLPFAINGKTPGPLITNEEGEEIEVFVDNQLATETNMHWHGVYQADRPWNDGVPGVTQYSIQPRDNYTYRFTVQQQYGIYFYHGHFGPAFADGQRGPVWISPAPWRPRPYKSISSSSHDIKGMQRAEANPRHIVISDWNAEPMDILLIMQDMYANPQSCQATDGELEVIAAEDGEEWGWINFIHSGAHHELQISIDEHEFYVVASDGEFVHPQKVHAANCNLGERISILVHLNQEPGDYTIRLTSLRVEQVTQGLGILRYTSKAKNSSDFAVPNTKPWVHLNALCTLKLFVNMTGPAAWSLGLGSHQAFRQQLPPLLWEDESQGDTTFGGQGSLLNGSVVDIIFENGANVKTQHPVSQAQPQGLDHWYWAWWLPLGNRRRSYK